MPFARAREARDRATKKGREAHNRSTRNYNKKRRAHPGGRIEMKHEKIAAVWGKHLVPWFVSQPPYCRICGPEILYNKYAQRKKNEGPNEKELAIDHDHRWTTEDFKNNPKLKPRGLLCHKHNRGLGHFNDSIEEIERALEYLREKEKSNS